ncbi:MAG: siderophore-interacting protein [Acidimicrobiales bacterium]|nr:siderophore-interacting protein [Acidimicrobiales bacterium]
MAANYGEVIETERITPRIIRVILGGEGLADFTPTPFTDQYVNALIIPDGAPYEVPFDVEHARSLAVEHRPAGRRYTIRWWDESTRRLALDFVVHGDVGRAGRWANHAQPGDRLQFLGPSGAYAPDPEADEHLMVGDESAIPAISASLERVPEGRRVQAVLVVDDLDNRLVLESPGELDIIWVHRCEADPGDRDQLLRAVEAIELGTGHVQAFVHGEANEVRSIRRHLLGERGIPREHTSISPYWRRDHTDEQWREVKKEWLREWEGDTPPTTTDS